MQNDPSMNGMNVICENWLHFDENDASNMSFNEKISISHDNAFGMKFEPQEASMNDLYITNVFKPGLESEPENLPVHGSIDSIGSTSIQRFNNFLFTLVLKILNKTKIFILKINT
mgnify:CR=1 FL=1